SEELEARNDIKWEIYTKKIQIEARVLGDMAINSIIPVATRYQSELIDNVYKMKSILGEEGEALSASNIDLIRRIAKYVHTIEVGVNELIAARKVANKIEDTYEKSLAYYNTVLPKMDDIRYGIDHLEEVVDDGLWPVPKYRELLFIR
ncbi:MAG: glutamine synthetase type III, partial [Bacteroidales bacterium]|nr:glutamine synthetase type III [Bacteroidales bacterium]